MPLPTPVSRWLPAVLAVVVLTGCNTSDTQDQTAGPEAPAASPTPAPVAANLASNLFFLHHSVGDGLVVEGEMRNEIEAVNAANGTAFELWDHGYNWEGLRDPWGTYTGTSYEVPGDNTDVEGLYWLWTSNEDEWAACRRQILDNHGVIAFKSCFPNSAIPDAATLAQYKQWYLAMRDVFDVHTDRRFVVMSTPPLHRLSTDDAEAANARAFASWLCSAEYVGGHANVACFDLFDHLAAPDDGSATANRLRYAYEMDHGDGDSHPNAVANQTVGPELARFLCQVASGR